MRLIVRRWRQWMVPAVILVVILAVWPRARAAWPVTGRLQVQATGTAQLGAYRLTMGPERLTVHRQGRTVFATPEGRSFVMAAWTDPRWRERRGSFFVRDRVRGRCYNQTVDAVAAGADHLVIAGALDCGPDGAHPYRLRFSPTDSGTLRFELDIADANRAMLTFDVAEGERLYGFGVQYTHMNMAGRRLPILVREQGIGRGRQPLTLGANLRAGAGGSWWTSYAPAPHMLSDRNRSLFLEEGAVSVFDFRAEGRGQVSVYRGGMVGQIAGGETPFDLIEAYTAYSGRMTPLPAWTQAGAVLGLQGGTEAVRRKLAVLRRAGTPVAGLWLQDWVGQRRTGAGSQLWWNWTLDKTHYPGWSDLVADMQAQDIRVLTYVNPFTVDAGAKPGTTRNLYEEARAAGHLVSTDGGVPHETLITQFAASLVDLTDDEARQWLAEVFDEEILAAGASGWMADFAEALPFDAVLADAEAAIMHNRWPELWAAFNREVADMADDDILFFVRSGYSRSPQHARLFWLGDQMTSWDVQDGLKSALVGLISGGLSGFTLNHFDIGGYTAVPNPLAGRIVRGRELLMRSAEAAAFTPFFRTHEGNRPDRNAQVYGDPELAAHFASMAKLYAALAPYRAALMDQAARRGLPLVRPVWLHYPDDERAHALRYEQFLLGPDLMVAPVTDPGVTQVAVYLPEGRWRHLITGRVYGPGTHRIAAPLGQPAALVKIGAQTGGLDKIRFGATDSAVLAGHP